VITHGVFVTLECHVVRFYPLQYLLLIRISVTPSKIDEGFLAESKHSNSTFIILYLYHEVDVRLDEMANISKII
jgi:hypothetical protein